MIEERGRVVAVEGGFAWVETERKSACGSCAVNKGCGTGVISKYFSTRLNHVKAVNQADAKVDDLVVIGLDEQALVRGSFAVYIVPLVLMFVCAFAGEWVAQRFQLPFLDGVVALFGVLGLFLGFLWVRRFSKGIAVDSRYQPIVMRIDVDVDCGVVSKKIRFDT